MKKPNVLKLEHLVKLDPLTANQKLAFDAFESGSHMCLDGSAGTGKTFISLYLALEAVLKKDYDKVVIVRSAVPTYKAIVTDLFDDGEAWDKLTRLNRKIEFLTTSFIRGLTIKNAVVIVDESQNCNYHELCSVITRLDEDCRFIMAGDYYQSDFTRKGDQDGIKNFINVIKHMNQFEHIEFKWEDIVRSGFVRDFIMTKELYENGKL